MSESEAVLGKNTILKRGDGGVGAGTKASKTVSTSNQQIVARAKKAGTAGNSMTFAVIVSGTSTAFSYSVSSTALTITSATNGGGTATTTVEDAIVAIQNDATYREYWELTTGVGDGSGILAASASSALSGGAAGTEVFTTVAFITDLTPPGRSRDLIDVTHYESDDDYREHMPTLKDGTEFSAELQWVFDNASQSVLFEDLEDGVKSNWQIYFAGTFGQQFKAYVTGIEPTAPIDDVIKLNVTFKVTGPITDI